MGLILAARPHAADAQKPAIGFLKRSITIDGTDYRYQVYVPAGWSTATQRPIVLSLHGAGGYGSDGNGQTAEGLAPAIRRHPERFPAVVVFPQAPLNGQPGWQGVGGRIAIAALDRTIEEFHADKKRVSLTGLSIGGNGAWFLAYHHPERFAALLVVCGFASARNGKVNPIFYPSLIPGTADPSPAIAQRISRIPTWIFHGDADRTVDVENSRRMFAALRAAGAPVQYTELPGVDHNSWDNAYNRPEVAHWLLSQHLSVVAQ